MKYSPFSRKLISLLRRKGIVYSWKCRTNDVWRLCKK